jgi:hypothetical protein
MLQPPRLGRPLFVAGQLQEFGWRQNQTRIFPVHASIPITELRKKAPERRSMLPWCRSVRVSVTARLKCRSDPSDCCEQRETPSRLCGCGAARRRRTAPCWRRDVRSPGSAQSRESLTQDSRSAVKARSFDPLRESFGEGRCTPRKAGVAASQEAVTWV